MHSVPNSLRAKIIAKKKKKAEIQIHDFHSSKLVNSKQILPSNAFFS